MDDPNGRARAILSAPPPDTVCSRHDLSQVTMVGEYIRQARSVEYWHACVRCALVDGAAPPEAVHDGHEWITDEGFPQAFRALYLPTVPEPRSAADVADRVWAQVVSAESPRRHRGSTQDRLRAWAYCLDHPSADPGSLSELLITASVVQDRSHQSQPVPDPMSLRPDELTTLVDESRVRWQSFTAAVWERLSEPTRDALAALRIDRGDDVPSALLETILVASLDELNRVLDGLRETWSGSWPTSGDLAAWGPRFNDYPRNDQLRALALHATVVGHAVPEDSPLVDVDAQPRFGPRTAEVEDLLDTLGRLTDVQMICLRQAVADYWTATQDEPVPTRWSRASSALSDAYQRRQLNWATWNQFVAFRDVFPDDRWLKAAAADAVESVMAPGFLTDEQAEPLGERWRAGTTAAAALEAAGPDAVARALRLADGWDADLPALVAAATS